MRPVHSLVAAVAAGIAAHLLVPTPAVAQARTESTVIMPDDPAQRANLERWGFADAVIHGDTVYLSGIVAGRREGETDPAAAYDRAFRQVGDILARAGSSWDDVLEMTTYHVDITGMDAFVAVKNRYVRAPFPAWTAIDVDRLAPAGGLAEIRVIAARRNAGPATAAR